MPGKLTPQPSLAGALPHLFSFYSCFSPTPLPLKVVSFCLPRAVSDLSTYLLVDKTVFSVIDIFSLFQSLLLFYFAFYPFSLLSKPVGQGEGFLKEKSWPWVRSYLNTTGGPVLETGWPAVWVGREHPAGAGDSLAVFQPWREDGEERTGRRELVHFRLPPNPPHKTRFRCLTPSSPGLLSKLEVGRNLEIVVIRKCI